MKSIPVHTLRNSNKLGLMVHHTNNLKLAEDESTKSAHRDDHYIFFFIEDGSASIMVDFEEVYICSRALYYILPGQVHHRIKDEHATGWFMAIDSTLMPKDYRPVFESHLLLQQPCCLNTHQYQQCQTLLQLIYQQYIVEEQSNFHINLLQSLVSAFLSMAAGAYSLNTAQPLKLSRPLQIAHDFKALLRLNIKFIKSPSDYAARMHISETYLNEVLKKVTGFSVSYWILNEIMLEAKRLLYYSELTVKEIAHQLGYEDHTYFSRLFKKANQLTPLSFRKAYRE
ncbi:AraC family transcriptional regulator [Mucilaginibacter robiniae]|uniref:AraC family transcriptional regulator n=1 Tax=Mucilaginibacter robiniae TaxID=2728022 RepID=A0A7L5E5F7_9SPHI|nr:helix-turn-helix domain-containing protein [Mucilaginibacter robiniae]QJD97858.1 AraC family transcriptional regulator [Mucilaginibacter robiniae]